MVKTYMVKSSRKSAVARASVKPGKGEIRVNNMALDAIYPTGYKKVMILEPTKIVPEEFCKFNYAVIVNGGGVSGQLQAIRSCIAKGIVLASGNKKIIKDKFLLYDRHLLVDDARNKEARKEGGPGARKKKQKSKR
jgi:small subunit ribosomal protein S9